MVCLLEIVLGLEADDEVRRDAEAELEAQGDGRADSLALANDIAELGGADSHGLGGLDLGDAVMFQCVPEDGGGGIGAGIWNLERVP